MCQSKRRERFLPAMAPDHTERGAFSGLLAAVGSGTPRFTVKSIVPESRDDETRLGGVASGGRGVGWAWPRLSLNRDWSSETPLLRGKDPRPQAPLRVCEVFWTDRGGGRGSTGGI